MFGLQLVLLIYFLSGTECTKRGSSEAGDDQSCDDYNDDCNDYNDDCDDYNDDCDDGDDYRLQ